jgi:hypothetical protein
LLIAYCSIFTVFLVSSVFTHAPFIPVKKSAVGEIIETLHLQPGSVLYDLGCGDARVLTAALLAHNDISAVGIEKNLIPYFFARWKTRKTKIEIQNKNFLKTDLRNATHIYIYLLPAVVHALFFKFQKECRPGTRIVSCDFYPQGITPDEIIDLPPSVNKLCKKLYVYVIK